MTSFDFVGEDLDLYQMEQRLTEVVRPMVDSRTITYIASKRNFNVEKETLLMEKARTSKCKCRHFTGTTPCYYRRCRHFPNVHYGVSV